MSNLHLNGNLKTKVSGGEMVLIPLQEDGGPLMGGLNSDTEEQKRHPAPVGTLPSLSGCPLVASTQLVWLPPLPLFVFSRRSLERRRYLSVPGTRRKTSHFPESLIPMKRIMSEEEL